MAELAKRLSDAHHAAVILHGLAQGLDILVDQSDAPASPASNAAVSLSFALQAHTCRLCDEIEAIEGSLRK